MRHRTSLRVRSSRRLDNALNNAERVRDSGDTQDSVTPLCECHGIPKIWHKMPAKRLGGVWRCRVKHREAGRRSDAKRVWIGKTYFGRMATAEQAAGVSTRGRQMLAEFKKTQKEARVAVGSRQS